MKYNGISFTENFWKTKTESEFVAHEKHHKLTEAQLKEAYALMTAKPDKKEKQKEAKSSEAENFKSFDIKSGGV